MKTAHSFDHLVEHPISKHALQTLCITEPTPAQERTIPLIKDGHDVICQSSTGSGKTYAFVLPILEHALSNELSVLVLVPTRELCEQVSQDFKDIISTRNINVLDVYGGVSIDAQIKKLPHAHIIVATPGRLCDLLNRKAIRLDTITTLVLDEADRMLDMGFINDVEFILKTTSRKRQTLMFSATIPRSIEHIITRHMRDPKRVKTKEQVDKHLLKQYYYVVPVRDRFHLLVQLLKEERAPYAIVFCGTRRAVDLVAYNLNKNGIISHAIHGGLTQAMRKQVMTSFHDKKTHILVASDIAARGLDIKMLTHVYNFDAPKTSQEYIHRIGRTARAGEQGIAITLLSDKDFDNFRRVQRDPSLNVERLESPPFPIVTFSPFIPAHIHKRGKNPHALRAAPFQRRKRFHRRR